MTEGALTVAEGQALERIKNAWARFARWWTVLRLAGVALLALAVLIGVLGYLSEHGGLYLRETPRRIFADFYANVSGEIASIAITLLVVDWLYQRRETEREKKRLILQMGSPDNAFAREAVRTLRSHGWLQDGSVNKANLFKANLREADLVSASLQGANLGFAKLQGAKLDDAKLQGADLTEAKLQGAELGEAKLQGAELVGASFQDASLWGANLQGTILWDANLQGADLREANLQGAKLEGAELEGAWYNDNTRWPKGFTPPPDAVNWRMEWDEAPYD